jgi:DNA invertase Pin-like site-specific DNA recombinase
VTTTPRYARLSTAGQELVAQRAALTAAGVETGRILTKRSGSAKIDRTGLAAMLDHARSAHGVPG